MALPIINPVTDEFVDYLRREHRGSGDELGFWACSCGAGGGGTQVVRAADWRRGHRQHVWAVARKLGDAYRAEQSGSSQR